jgi:tetratricopeptide (TPR) repeat protein
MPVCRHAIVFCFILLGARLASQDSPLYKHRVDSVRQIVAAGRNDSQMVEALNTLSMLAWRKGRYEKSDSFSNQALLLAGKLGQARGEALAFSNKATVAWYKGNYPEALKLYLAALKIFEQSGYKAGLSDAYNNVGMVHYYLRNYDKTIAYYMRSLKIDQELGALNGVALSYNNIAGVYEELGNARFAKNDLQAAEENYDKAIAAYDQAVAWSEKGESRSNLALCYANLGNVFLQKALLEEKRRGDGATAFFKKSLEFHQRSLDLKQQTGDQFGLAGSYNFLGEVFLNMRRYPEAIVQFEKGLALSFELGARERRKYAYIGLANTYEKMNDPAQAFKYRLLYAAVKDSIYSEELSEQIAGMQTRYETEKKEQQISLLNKEQAIQGVRLGRQQVIIWSAVAMLLVLLASGLYVLNRYKVARKQKRIIEGQKQQVERAYVQLHEKNTEILDSIHYARRIQRALITPEKYIQRVLDRLTQTS